MSRWLLISSLLTGVCSTVMAFVARPATSTSPTGARHPSFSVSEILSRKPHELYSTPTDGEYSLIAVVAPLKYEGPYACLRLRFKDLDNTFEFVLDTGATVNTIDAKLVDKLNMPLVASSKDLGILGSAGIGGSISAGDVYQVGDCELDGLPPEQTTRFMNNLTAAAFERSTPVGDGLLGLNFFLSFPAGVEFDWYGTDGDPPTLIFYYGKDLPTMGNVRQGLKRVPLKLLPVGLLSITININGTEMPALLDTGSPITVLNQEAADLAGIEVSSSSSSSGSEKLGKQQYGDENLMVGGVDGVPVNLYRSKSKVPIRAGDVSFGEGLVYVGDLPGLKAIEGILGSESKLPAVVLGLDSLRRTYRMILRATEAEVYFEELPNKE